MNFHILYIHGWGKEVCHTLSPQSYIHCGIWNPQNEYLEFKEKNKLKKLSGQSFVNCKGK